MTIENGAPEKKVEAVKVTNKAMVLPRKAPEKPTCPLVTFDLPYITFYYNQKLLIYKSGSEEFAEVVERLKQGLAAALEYFYPLAGRLKQDEEKVLYVECEGEGLVGAEVVEAAAEGVAAVELAEGDSNPGLLQELVPYTGVMNLEGLHRPLLAVQFTKLKDGIAIGCAFNHAILDGNSTWHFMSSWADLSRGADTISVLPLHDRTLARSARLPLSLPPSAHDHEIADPNKGPSKSLVARVFSFSEAAVDLLKSRANAGAASKHVSTFQSIGAHIWRAVCRARALKPEDITVFAVFADCRSRMDPPMPDAYFGNLIQAIFTGTAAGLLLSSPPEFGAGMLQQVIDAHNAEAIKKKLEEYEAAPKLFYYSDGGMNCVAVGSSPRFKVYDVEFGFGKPERVRSGSNNKFDGMVYLYPGREGGRSIDVELTLQGEAMERLEKDEDFLVVKA
ncbi:BAHD acyltransferase DCR [Canna indica]|uniref:BAHD acyltransferase DCR n=1 Tax=Canna indica TaxID=4628 RepID=A0AAQ3JUV3_9LILI|nr:BAHD acyltransferase DCR [Canna indica]